MFEISRILAPVVFSDNCRGALRYAISLAARFRAEVSVLHVLERTTYSDFDSTVEMNFLEKARHDWVHREFENLTAGLTGRVPIAEACVDGDPATQIVKVAEKSDSNLIVMATHGHGPFRRFLLGSVTAKVLHDTNCAVCTGAHLEHALDPKADPDHLHNVLCAVDFGRQTEAVLECATEIASTYAARLSLLHVFAPSRDPEQQRRECVQTRQRLEGLRTSDNATSECYASAGDVAEQVGRCAREINADLVVIGRGHIAGGGRLRSTCYAILRESPCAVVSV